MQRLAEHEINPDIKSQLIEALITSLNKETKTEEIKLILARCIIKLLQLRNMECFYSRNVLKLTALCDAVLKFLKSSVLNEDVFEVFCRLINVCIAIQHRNPEDFTWRNKFVKTLMIPLILLLQNDWKGEDFTSKSLIKMKIEVIRCIQLVVFPKAAKEIFESILDYIFGEKLSSKYETDILLVQLNKFKLILSSDDQALANEIVFQAYVTSYKTSLDLIIKMFGILCTINSIRPKLNGELDYVDRLEKILAPSLLKKEKVTDCELHILRNLLEVLSNQDLNLDICKMNSEDSGRQYLARVVTCLTNSFTKDEAASLLLSLCPVSTIDSSIMESALQDIMKRFNTFRVNKPITDAFGKLFVCAIKAAEKQQRANKVLCCFIEGFKSNKRTKDFELHLIITDELLNVLNFACFNMHSKNYIATLSSLIFYLEKECIEKLENDADEVDYAIQILQMLTKLILTVLSSPSILKTSTTDLVLSKFNVIIDKLSILLGRLGKLIIKTPSLKNEAVLLSFLELANSWGEIKLVQFLYSTTPETSLLNKPENENKIVSDSVFDLSLLHNYLSAEKWIQVGALSTSETYVLTWNNLLCQKLRSYLLCSIGQKHWGNLVNCISINYFSFPWPSRRIDLMSIIVWLDVEHRQMFAEKALQCLISYKEEMLFDEIFHCELNFFQLLLLSLLRKVVNTSFGITKQVFSEIDFSNLKSIDIKIIGKKLNKCINSDLKPVEISEELKTFYDVLIKLPLESADKKMQIVCSLIVLSSCCNLKSHMDIALKILLKLSVSNSSYLNLSSNVDHGLLLSWMLKCKGMDSLDSSLQEAIVKALLGNCKDPMSYLNTGLSAVKEAIKNDITPFTAVVINYVVTNLHASKDKSAEFQSAKNELCENILKKKSILIFPSYCSALLTLYKTNNIKDSLCSIPQLLEHKDNYKYISCVIKFLTLLEDEGQNILVPLLIGKFTSLNYLSDEDAASLGPILEKYCKNTNTQINLVELNHNALPAISKALIFHSSDYLPNARNFQDYILVTLVNWNYNESCLQQLILPIFELMLRYIKTPKLCVEYIFLDTAFQLITSANLLERSNEEELIKLVDVSIQLLNAMVTLRMTLISDRIPQLQQRINIISTAIARNSSPTLDEDLVERFTSLADSLNRLATSLYIHKRDFTRVVPYMIGNIIFLFENYKIHTSVKESLARYIRSLLSMCDEHGEHYMLSWLSPAGQQLLRRQLEIYKRSKEKHV